MSSGGSTLTDGSATGSTVTSHQPDLPTWFEVAVVFAALVVALVGAFGLFLALIDQFRTSLTLAVSLPLAAGLMAVQVRRCRPAGMSRNLAVGWALAAAIAVGFVVFVGTSPSQHLLLDRDPGSYQSTARWLADNPGLEVQPEAGAFDDAAPGDLVFAGGAVYAADDGRLQFQFNHLTAVVMAVAFDLFGRDAMLLLPALVAGLALMAVYAVTARVTGRSHLSLLAPAALAVSMPLLFVARDTYSEPFVLALLWAGMLPMLWNYRRPSIGSAAIGGLLIGSLVAARVDALVVVALLFPLVAISTISVSAGRRSQLVRSYCAMTVALGAMLLLGFVDLRTRAGSYEADLASQLGMLRLATVASLGLSALLLVASASPEIRRRWRPWGRRSATGVAVALVSVLLMAWLLRPLLQIDRVGSGNSTVVGIQARDELGADPARTYAEFSLWWMSWYLGPATLLAAICGAGVCARRSLRGTANSAMVAVLALCLGTGAMYWWRPSNTPDHIWVMRRYVPSVLPCLVVLAVVSVAVALTRAESARSPRARVALVGSVAVVAMVGAPLWTTWPVRSMSFQPGYVDVVEDLCDVIGDDAAVVVAGSYEQLVLAQPIRSWCGVPVAAMARVFSAADLAALSGLAAAQGRQLWLVGMDGDSLATWDVDAGEVVSTTTATASNTPVARLDGPPTEYVDPDDVLPATVPVPFALHARAVTPG